MHIAILTAPNALKDETQTISKLPAILQRLNATPIIPSDSSTVSNEKTSLPLPTNYRTQNDNNKDQPLSSIPSFPLSLSTSLPSILISDSFHAVIVEEQASLNDTGYLIAFALMKKKPILYLVSKYKLPSQESYLHYLKYAHGQGEKYVHVRYYDVLNLQRLTSEFLERIKKDPRVDRPKVKFTLRLTDKLEGYLTWKSGRSHKSKAKVIRSAISGMMDEDTHYPPNHESREDEKPTPDPVQKATA